MAVDLKAELTSLEANLGNFHKQRKLWDQVVRRELEVELPPEITTSEAVDYQSADLEKDIFDHVEVLRMNPTRFDIFCLDTSEDAKKAERMALLTMTRTWADMNRDRWWDAAVAEGQVRHGVKVMWLRWKQPDKSSEVKGAKDNEIRQRWPFYWSNVNIYGSFWTMKPTPQDPNNSDVFYYKYTVPIHSCDLGHSKGKKLTLGGRGEDGRFRALDAIGWMGLDEEQDTAISDKTVDVIVRDARDLSGKMCPLDGCDHPMRKITIHVCAEGQFDKAEKVEEYESPFPGCSFLVIGARESFHETDFHQKFRPLMLPEYQEQNHLNYLKTLLATQVREAYGDQDVYVRGDTIPAHIAASMNEGGLVGSIDRSQIDSNEIPIMPGQLDRWPKQIDPHLVTLIQDSQKKMADFRPNRFVIGNAFTEASNATGTAFLQQAQQAALPYNGLLGQSDGAIKRAYEYMFHAIRVFGLEDKGFVTRYVAVTTGQESTRRYGAKAGELVWIDAEMLSNYDFDILLKTESQTVAEEGARWLQAVDKHTRGVFTTHQLYEAAGIFDVELQDELLYADMIRGMLLPTEMQLAKGLVLMKASAQTGTDFTALEQQIMQQGQGPQTGDAGTVSGVPVNDNMGRAAEQVALSAASVAGGAAGGSSPVA